MWQVYFGQWQSGRLKRLPYLGYDVLLMVLGFVIVMGMFLLAGGSMEGMLGMDPTAFLESMGLFVIFGIFIVFIALGVANLNIMAKRFRDMGLPAWGMVAGTILVSIVLNLLFPSQQMEVNTAVVDMNGALSTAGSMHASTGSIVTEGFNLFVFLCLVLIPSDTFGNKNTTAE
ncbi:hypothetical protein MNB_SV-4-1216 [hydrothermal vent metagenome]|uniref:Uncharacterized protein n=1 Tax=hydrothermal vent metagenome TaxID=652676 RepID=A0A1W1E8F6_9ZZZZ